MRVRIRATKTGLASSAPQSESRNGISASGTAAVVMIEKHSSLYSLNKYSHDA
jgi:hypothetical protein